MQKNLEALVRMSRDGMVEEFQAQPEYHFSANALFLDINKKAGRIARLFGVLLE
jgi:hypothetical protein